MATEANKKQIDCFNINVKFWRFLGVWPSGVTWPYYKYYSKFFTTFFIFIYDFWPNPNFLFLPRQMDKFVEELIFYFTELAVASKVLTFLMMHDKIVKIMDTLESDMFQPSTEHGIKIINGAKKFNKKYYKIIAAISVTSHLTHVLSPLITHILLHIELELPLCSYSFIPDKIREKFIYPLYAYQTIGMHFHMLFNLNIDTYLIGLIILTIAQLDIIDEKLRRVTDVVSLEEPNTSFVSPRDKTSLDDPILDKDLVNKLNGCVIHFDEIGKFCSLIQEVFSMTLFVQFSMASCIICVCLFRFTLPAPFQYYIFLATYMFVMIGQILVPCWFGTRIIDKSNKLGMAVYDCDWTPRSRRFKSNLRLLVERTSSPLSIIGGKMFPLSLITFTSIMNSAYSFFTLLRHMQSRQ